MRKILYLSVIILLFITTASAPPETEYKITYTIKLNDDGTAVWNVEYRTPLISNEDFASFDNYTAQLKQIHLKEFKELMQNSVSEAANATSRNMMAGGFSGDASIQSAPTGNFGVVHYSFIWTNFAKIDPNRNINIGDVFVGGLYLSKDNTLIIQYPSGYTVEQVTPQPDQVRDGLIWYGLRSFKKGEPAVSLLKTPSSWIQFAIIIFIIAGGIVFLIFYFRKAGRRDPAITEGSIANIKERPSENTRNTTDNIVENITENITETDLMDLEDRVVKLLKESGGSLFQSEIGRRLNLPKSTVSSALNELHNKNMIQKIKRGRENLIRLI